MRLALEVTREVRANWPTRQGAVFPRFIRRWRRPGRLSVEDSVALARELHQAGVDVVDCSSGGFLRSSAVLQNNARGLGFQVPYADQIRHGAQIPTMAVGHPRRAAG